jgi:hypothetical protein
MLFLKLLVALCFLGVAFGIYESQLGEYDWLKQNIGIVKKTIYNRDGDRMFVITEDSVLACIKT